MSKYELHLGDCLEVMRSIPAGSVDLIITSPPYDNTRDYNGSISEWSDSVWMDSISLAYSSIKEGGVMVWIVSDATINGSETGTSFKQALHAISVGFKLHDTMIWNKNTFTAVGTLKTRYASVFEYMFIFVKGKISTFNPIKDRPNKSYGRKVGGTIRLRDGSTKPMSSQGKEIKEFGQRFNVWTCNPVMARNDCRHPAPFPVELVNDHIKSWSNPGDVVLDIFMGSGTTGVACMNTGRRFIGIEKDAGYFQVAQGRIMEAAETNQQEINQTSTTAK